MATKVQRTDAERIADMKTKMMDRPNRNLGVSLWSGADYTPRTTPIPAVAPLTADKIGKPAGQSLRSQPVPTAPVATQPMKNFIHTLLAEKDHNLTDVDVDNLTFTVAKYIIETLKNLPRKAVANAAAEMAEGMYTKDGVIYKVQMGSKGFLYALVLNEAGKFDYVAGAIRKITAADRMTLEEAKAYGKKTGSCCVCARELTNPNSIEAGIGPICAGKF